MKTYKNLGIWMDHATANLIEFEGTITSHTIESDFTHNKKVDALHKSENLMHNKEQQMHEAYYKKLGDKISKYDHVLLFGPTNAKTELHNYLSKYQHLTHTKIDIRPADKMTDNEQVAFVKKHFETK